MFGPHQFGRRSIALAYMLACIVAHCAHEHGPQRATSPVPSGHEDRGHRLVQACGPAETAADDCLACNFLSENPSLAGAGLWVFPEPAGAAPISPPAASLAILPARATCRAPPRA